MELSSGEELEVKLEVGFWVRRGGVLAGHANRTAHRPRFVTRTALAGEQGQSETRSVYTVL